MLLPLFEWIEDGWLGSLIANSIWAFPVIEAVHLIGLCLLGGSILIVDLRMLGVGLTRQSIAELNESARTWLVRALFLMVGTGLLLFVSEAVKCYYNTSFWVKITTLPIAIAFTFLVRNRIAADPELETSAKSRGLAVVSIALWLTVAAAGRWIGYS